MLLDGQRGLVSARITRPTAVDVCDEPQTAYILENRELLNCNLCCYLYYHTSRFVTAIWFKPILFSPFISCYHYITGPTKSEGSQLDPVRKVAEAVTTVFKVGQEISLLLLYYSQIISEYMSLYYIWYDILYTKVYFLSFSHPSEVQDVWHYRKSTRTLNWGFLTSILASEGWAFSSYVRSGWLF